MELSAAVPVIRRRLMLIIAPRLIEICPSVISNIILRIAWMLPLLSPVLATAGIKLLVCSVSNVNVIRIHGVVLGFMVLCRPVILTIAFGGENKIRSAPIIVLWVLALL